MTAHYHQLQNSFDTTPVVAEPHGIARRHPSLYRRAGKRAFDIGAVLLGAPFVL